MHYDFIEIGTSDFDTEIERAREFDRGISIDPIIHYLNKLPNKKYVNKVLCGISDRNTWGKCYYISEENIQKYNLPWWIRGCNQLFDYHTTAKNIIIERELNLDTVFDTVEIPIYSISTLLDMYQVSSINYLKIDTEGHDITILKNYINKIQRNSGIIAKQLLFESNTLSDRLSIDNMIEQLYSFGYRLIYSNENTLMHHD